MEPALHQDSRPAKRERLVNLLKNGLERLDVSLGRARRTIKRAEGTIFRAEIRVINVAVNLVGDNVPRMKFPADRIGFHADTDKVVGAKKVKRLVR